jgi:hypothetical protein
MTIAPISTTSIPIAAATIPTVATIPPPGAIGPVAKIIVYNNYLLLLNHPTLFSHIKHHKHYDQDCEQTNEPPHVLLNQ